MTLLVWLMADGPQGPPFQVYTGPLMTRQVWPELRAWLEQHDKNGGGAFYHKSGWGGTGSLQGYSLVWRGKESSGACWRRCLLGIVL